MYLGPMTWWCSRTSRVWQEPISIYYVLDYSYPETLEGYIRPERALYGVERDLDSKDISARDRELS